MDGASVTPSAWWALGAVCTSLVTAGPAYLAARRSRGAAQTEGELTRSAVSEAFGEVNGRIDQLGEGLRSDIREVRDWQAAHTTEHAVTAFQQMNPQRRMEFRRNEE